eukprot:Sdes_comp22031_c0_seq1m20566
MAKAKIIRNKVRKRASELNKKASVKGSGKKSVEVTCSEPSLRLGKKLLKRKEKHAKFVSKLVAIKKKVDKDKELAVKKESYKSMASFDSLFGAIHEIGQDSCGASSSLTASKTTSSLIGSRKSRTYNSIREVNLFKAVLSHSDFQSDPFASLQNHIANQCCAK